MTPESDALLETLQGVRQHVLGILEGLDEEALRRPVLPTGWNCLGLISHLTVDVERFWFRAVTAGDQDTIDELALIGDEVWQVPADVPAAAVLDGYRKESARADEIIAAADLDAAPAWWPPELFGGWRLDTVRDVLLHVIVEEATHAGHLDATRELIDGRTWVILTG
ncbi:MAG: DinB family protein [Sciscionella sp.]